MDSKFPLLSPFNYDDWKPKMSAYLKRQCLFDVSIGALSEPGSYEEKIDWINNFDRYYGIICLVMSLNIHHLIDSAEYPFELWNNLDKAFGLQQIEDEALSEPHISSCSLSQDLLDCTFSTKVDHDEEFSHTVHVAAILFDLNASSFNEEANIEDQSFFVSLEDTDDEKKVTNGDAIVIDDDSLTHSLFFIYSILYSEIYVPDLSHFVHISLIDGAQPSVFIDDFLAKSSLMCVRPLTLLDRMCFIISFYVLRINTRNLCWALIYQC